MPAHLTYTAKVVVDDLTVGDRFSCWTPACDPESGLMYRINLKFKGTVMEDRLGALALVPHVCVAVVVYQRADGYEVDEQDFPLTCAGIRDLMRVVAAWEEGVR